MAEMLRTIMLKTMFIEYVYSPDILAPRDHVERMISEIIEGKKTYGVIEDDIDINGVIKNVVGRWYAFENEEVEDDGNLLFNIPIKSNEVIN